MEMLIDDKYVSPDQVTFSELGFGTTEIELASAYELRIPAQEFVARFAAVYEVYVEELKRDDAITGEEYPSHSMQSDYPSLQELLEINGREFHDFVYTFLKFDIFEEYFSEADPSSARFALGTADEILVDQSNITIRGRARDRA